MVKFSIVNDVNQIQLSNNWKDAAKFNSLNRIVNDKGTVVTQTYSGNKFRLIAKKELHYSCFERLVRALLATTIAVTILPLVFKDWRKTIRQLFSSDVKKIRFGIPFNSDEPLKSKVKDSSLLRPSEDHDKTSEKATHPASSKDKMEASSNITDKDPLPEPQLPPLPRLGSIQLTESIQQISPRHFVTDPAMLHILENGTKEDKDHILKHGLDNELLDFNLIAWCGFDAPFDEQARNEDFMKAVEAAKRANHLKLLKADPQRASKIKIIQTRIDMFNHLIQMDERLGRLREKACFLTIRELMKKWENSKLKYALMMDEELEILNPSELNANDLDWYKMALATR